MAKLKSGTRIYGTATIDTSVVVGSAVTLSSSGIRVGSGASVGIGTTNPAEKLHVIGNVRIAGALYASDISGISTSGTSGQVLQSVGTGISWVTSGGGATISNSPSGTLFPTMSSATSGTFTTATISSSTLTFTASTGRLSATQFTSLSDVNKKKNIRPIENAIDITKKLEGVRFDWKETNSSSIGVIAQEVEKVLPELVTQGDVKSVNYNGLIGVLIGAVKEQQKQIEELKDFVKNLTSTE